MTEENDITRIHREVVAVLRKYKLNTAVTEEVNTIFGQNNPTVSVATSKAIAPKSFNSDKVTFFKAGVDLYDSERDYVTVIGWDGIDVGKELWLVGIPKDTYDSAGTMIRRNAKTAGYLNLPKVLPMLSFTPMPVMGEKVPAEIVRTTPGLYYCFSRHPNGDIRGRRGIVVIR